MDKTFLRYHLGCLLDHMGYILIGVVLIVLLYSAVDNTHSKEVDADIEFQETNPFFEGPIRQDDLIELQKIIDQYYEKRHLFLEDLIRCNKIGEDYNSLLHRVLNEGAARDDAHDRFHQTMDVCVKLANDYTDLVYLEDQINGVR